MTSLFAKVCLFLLYRYRLYIKLITVISQQLSVSSYQLSVISQQLSVISYQLSVISYQGCHAERSEASGQALPQSRASCSLSARCFASLSMTTLLTVD